MPLEKLNIETLNIKGINILDIVVIIIFLLSIISGYKKGFVYTLFDLSSFFISTIISMKIYPIVSNFLKSTLIFNLIENKISSTIKISSTFANTNKNIELEFLDSLQIPNIFTKYLKLNYNDNTYNIFNINNIKEYVTLYFSSIICNIISAIIVFITVFILMKIISKSLNIVANLPVIHTFNKTLGVALGILKGFLFTWLGCILYTLFFVKLDSKILDLMLNSKFAIYFYENNFILNYITKIFK